MIFYVIWRVWVLAMWFGIMFAVCTVVIAVALCAVICAVAMGILMPSRTVRGQLRSLVLHATQGTAMIRAMDHR